MNLNRIFLTIFLVIPGLISGCGGSAKPADLPKLYPCKITVIQDNKPLEGAIIAVQNDLGFVIAGKTDAKGVAIMTVDGRWPGVPEGEHLVTISKVVAPESNTPAPQSLFTPEGRKWMEMTTKATKQTVDPKYASTKTSDLRLKVGKKSAKETFDVGAAVSISISELSRDQQ